MPSTLLHVDLQLALLLLSWPVVSALSKKSAPND
jgi:hypothetical protein